jgi:hypothetical protein
LTTVHFRFFLVFVSFLLIDISGSSPQAGASAYRPASEALRLTCAALSTAAANRYEARAHGGTERPKPNADARERTVLFAMAERFQVKRPIPMFESPVLLSTTSCLDFLFLFLN